MFVIEAFTQQDLAVGGPSYFAEVTTRAQLADALHDLHAPADLAAAMEGEVATDQWPLVRFGVCA